MTESLHFDPKTATDTRESWLHRAIEAFRPRFIEIGYELPEKIHVSIGFSFGSKRENKVIAATTWHRAASEDGVNHLFISPEDSDTARILETLLHELIHVVLDNEDGHKGRFAEIATRLGFDGPMTTTPASIALAMDLVVLATELGDFPHGKLTVPVSVKTPDLVGVGTGGVVLNPTSGPRPQRNRYMKVVCPGDCAYSVRMSRSQINRALPLCGICGSRMTVD